MPFFNIGFTLLAANFLLIVGPSSPSDAPTLKTKRGTLRGMIINNGPGLPPVEAYLGVPYAAPPTRFMPPTSPPTWSGIREAREFASVCPQRLPKVLANKTAALLQMSRDRYNRLLHLRQYVERQSEDCLYLNVYTPARTDERSRTGVRHPVLVFVPGEESFSYGTGNSVDGSILASFSSVVVVTLNYRVGVLGFLNTNLKPTRAVSNYGLLDLVAALEFVRLSAEDFGGDPANVTVLGQGTGAACVNHLMTSASTPLGVIFHRAILMSGSSLAPWALLTDPLNSTLRLATALHCPLQSPQLLFCLRQQPLTAIFDSLPEQFEFVPSFGPSIDGIVVGDELLVNQPAYSHRLNSYQLLLGVWSEAAGNYHVPTGAITRDMRDRILATYIRNTYSYHLNELFSTLKYQYTDWTSTTEHEVPPGGKQLADPRIARQLTEILNDARYTAPQVHTASLMARSKHVYFYVLQTGENSAAQAAGGEIPLVFGYPLLGDKWYGRNWTQEEKLLSMQMMNYWANFARSGDPNQPRRAVDLEGVPLESSVDWLRYNTHRRHLLLGDTCRMSSHYRADKVALWLNLLPELHRRGHTAGTPVQHRHHRLDQHQYHGAVRTVPATWHVLPAPRNGEGTSGTATSLSAETNVSAILDPGASEGVASSESGDQGSRGLPAAFGAAYSSALGVTVAIGCSLLVLNMLTLAAVYHQRQKQRRQQQLLMSGKLPAETAAADSCGSANSCRCILSQPADALNHLSSTTLDCELSSTLINSNSPRISGTSEELDKAGPLRTGSSPACELYSGSDVNGGVSTDMRSRERAQPPPQFADQQTGVAEYPHHHHLHHVHHQPLQQLKQSHLHQQQMKQRRYSGGHFDTSIVIDETAVCPFSAGSLPRQRLTSCDLVNSNAVKKSANRNSREKLSELRV